MTPNVVVFMTDHQRADTIYPRSRAITPHVEALAKSGTVFSSAYCPAPHCCPSRASFYTGLFPSEHGVWNNVNVGNTLASTFYEGTEIFVKRLRESGYTSYFSGKWHVSNEMSPLDCGFDVCAPKYHFAKKTGYLRPDPCEWDYYQPDSPLAKSVHAKSSSDESPQGLLRRAGYPDYVIYGALDSSDGLWDEKVVADSVDQIKQAAANQSPFFAFCGTIGPHDPYCVPEEFLALYPKDSIKLPENFYDDMKDKPNLYRRTKERFGQLSEDEYREAIRHYLAYCSYEDALFGKVVSALKESGVYDNTVILYLSDHGDYAGEHGLFAKGLPCFEGAYNIPLVIGGGFVTQYGAKIISDFVYMTDLAPTLLELCGVTPVTKGSSKSLLPYIKGEKIPPLHTEVYTQTNGNELYGIQRSVRTKKYKYIYNGFDYDELYDLKKDPLELCNRIDDPSLKEVRHSLSRKLWQFARDTGDVCINPYIMVSLCEFGPGIVFEEE